MFKIKRMAIFPIIIAVIILVASVYFFQKRDMSVIDQNRAIEIAGREFERHGRQVSDYDVTSETYSANGKQWIVWFEKKGEKKTPGGKHAVLVDKKTGQPVFMAGE